MLDRANETHTKTVEAVEAVRGVEVAAAEVHVVRDGAIVERGRPVVAGRTHHTVDRSPVAGAGSGQENRSMLFQCVPLRCCYRITGVICIACVCTVQCVVAAAPVIGQQDYAVYAVHICFGIENAASSSTRIENIHPLIFGQCPPAAVLFVAPVADGVIAPVGFSGLVIQIVSSATVCVIIAVSLARAPRLVADSTVVIATGAPTEEVAVNIGVCASLSIIS